MAMTAGACCIRGGAGVLAVLRLSVIHVTRDHQESVIVAVGKHDRL